MLILKEEGRGITSRKKLIKIRSLIPQTNSDIKNLTLQGDSRSFKKVKEEVSKPANAAEKAKHQKDTVRAKRIIADSIKDHLIPYVSSKKTLKEMFDALTRLYEGKNINRKMNLRTQLKNTRMQKGETIQEYFSRISKFKEQLEEIGDIIEEDKLVMTALNGLTRPWDAFIQTICARKEIQFEILWEECN